MNDDDLRTRFSHHPPPTERRILIHQNIRAWFFGIASDICRHTPPGREQSLAITKLEEAMFWANAAVARQGADNE